MNKDETALSSNAAPLCDDVYKASVIVEVPNQSVNRAFDYVVNGSLVPKVKVGSRVVVPFGARHVQGFVIDLITLDGGSEAAPRNLKEINDVQDAYAVLTPELIKLSEWMSQTYICLRIRAIQCMLPAALRSQSKKGKGPQDRITKQRISMVRKTFTDKTELSGQVSERATKQREVLHYLAEKSAPQKLVDVLEACQTSASTVRELQKKGAVIVEQVVIDRDPFADRTFEKTYPLALTAQQEAVMAPIVHAVENSEHRTFLLQGVTGSGKTEVYLQSIARCLEQGKEAIVLVPEISLTPQMVERFKGRFGDEVAVVHSRLSPGERYDEWRKIIDGRVRVVVGARSAIFSPFKHIGLIIIDEEHETSYKQEESPRYHARDVAIKRGQYHHAPVILGSATPALESAARAEKNVYHRLRLTERIQGRSLPPVHIMDMRRELATGNRSMFSKLLYEKIEEKWQKGEQILLFLNRRGFSTFIMCRDCGYVAQCPHCDISLTYHRSNETLRCHYCGYTEPLPQQCTACNSNHIRFFGSGTQRVEEELQRNFPGMRVVRMDVDTTRRKGAHEALLNRFRNGNADCLLGTQMIAKGLDFENVTLVGVITADALLHLPDFRASEKTFQLLTQVSGRAGRHHKAGEVIVQTYSPEHPTIQAASKHDYETFYENEMQFRKQNGYPPYTYIALITYSHEQLSELVKVGAKTVQWLSRRVGENGQVLGPVPSPIPRINDRYRYQCMIKYKNESVISPILNTLWDTLQPALKNKQLQVQIDMHPQMMM